MPEQDPSWGRYVGLGLQMAIGVGLGLFFGSWLDGRYGWGPWGVLVCSMLGMAAGMYLLIKDALAMNRDDPKPKAPPGNDRSRRS